MTKLTQCVALSVYVMFTQFCILILIYHKKGENIKYTFYKYIICQSQASPPTKKQFFLVKVKSAILDSLIPFRLNPRR
jgi:hypothetical protein